MNYSDVGGFQYKLELKLNYGIKRKHEFIRSPFNSIEATLGIPTGIVVLIKDQ